MSDLMSDIAHAINREAVYGDPMVSLPLYRATEMAAAALRAIDAAGYQVVQKPLDLTPEMAAACMREALHIVTTQRLPRVGDGRP